MKIANAFVLIFSLACMSSLADEFAYPSGERHKELLSQKELLWVVKVGGIPSFDQYVGYFRKENISIETLAQRWGDSYPENIPDQFLVKAVYSGAVNVGEIVLAFHENPSSVFTNVGDEYLIFFDRKDQALTYEQCNVASVRRFTHGNDHAGLRVEKEKVIDRVVDEKLLSCFVHEIK